jgi:hypothetical protein
MGWTAALTAFSTGVSILGKQHAANGESSALKYQADQATADADAERGAAQVQAIKIRKAGRAQQSQARAALAASGVDVGVGTANTINEQIMKNTEEDALTAILNGNYGAQRKLAQAQGYRTEAENVKNTSKINTLTSALAGGAMVASGWKTSVRTPDLSRVTDGNPQTYGNYA